MKAIIEHKRAVSDLVQASFFLERVLNLYNTYYVYGQIMVKIETESGASVFEIEIRDSFDLDAARSVFYRAQRYFGQLDHTFICKVEVWR